MVLILVIVFVLPWGVGYVIQDRYPKILQTISQTGQVQLTLDQYDRGWFASQAVIRVRVSHPEILRLNGWLNNNEGAPLEFILIQGIDHGPLLHSHPLLGKNHWYIGQALIDTRIDPVLGKVDSLTLVQLNGSLMSIITAPKLVYQNSEQRVNAEIHNFNSVLHLSSNLKKISGHANLPQITIQASHFQQNIFGFDIHFNLKRNNALFLGDKETKIQEIALMDPVHQSQIILRGLHLHSVNTEKNNKLDYKLLADLTSLDLDQNHYGAQKIDISVCEMDVPSLLDFLNELKKAPIIANITPMQLMHDNNLLLALLAKGLVVELKSIRLSAPSGTLSLSGKIVFPTQTTQSPSLFDILNVLDMNLRLQISKSFLTELLSIANLNIVFNRSIMPGLMGVVPSSEDPKQKAQVEIARLVENKWLIPEGDTYTLNLIYKNKQLIVNEQSKK